MLSPMNNVATVETRWIGPRDEVTDLKTLDDIDNLTETHPLNGLATPDDLATPDATGAPDAVDAPDDAVTLEGKLDRLDTELLNLVRERTAVAHRLTVARVQSGGPRFVHKSELAVVRRFRQLGPAGGELAAVLLRLAR